MRTEACAFGLGDPGFEAAFERGRRMSLDEALDLVVDIPDSA